MIGAGRHLCACDSFLHPAVCHKCHHAATQTPSLQTPQREKERRPTSDRPTACPVSTSSLRWCSIIVRVPRPARRRGLGAAVSHRSRRTVVPSAGPRRRRPGRWSRCRVGAPAACPGRRGWGIQRTRRGRVERARGGSVECGAGCGSTQTTRGRRVICGRRRAPSIVAGAWSRRRDAICWSLGSRAPRGITATAGVSWGL